MRTVSAMGAVLCLTLAACGGGSGNTEPAPTLSITLSTNSIESGTSAQASASIGGSPASDVTWSSSNEAVASVTSTGVVTGALAGSAIIHATSGSSTGQVSVTVVPGAPASMTIVAGDGQSGPPGSQLSTPLCTNVKDAAGNLIIGAIVSYSVTTGGGQLADPTTPETGADGIAISGLWTLGSSTGTQTVTASSAGAGSVTFTAIAAAAPSVLSVTLPTNPVVSGNSVQASASIGGSPAPDVMWSSSNPAVASISSNGRVSGALQGNATIHATSGNSTAQVVVTVVPGPAARVSIYAGGGQAGAAGSQLGDPLCTQVYDAAGNLLIGVQVSYAVASGGGHVGSPAAPATDASGIAISGLWTLGPARGPQTVLASSGTGSVTFTATAQ
jgi:hypothetical protein